MKRIIILIASIAVISIVIYSYNYIQYTNKTADVTKFNKIFLEYDKQNLYGTDVTTVINKAIDNNEKNKIKKDENDVYILDNEYSTEIYIKFEDEGELYPMESLYKAGIQEFTKFFGELNFKCTKKTYHDNGRIAIMEFSAINYKK